MTNVFSHSTRSFTGTHSNPSPDQVFNALVVYHFSLLTVLQTIDHERIVGILITMVYHPHHQDQSCYAPVSLPSG
jgi:hypothetical protein